VSAGWHFDEAAVEDGDSESESFEEEFMLGSDTTSSDEHLGERGEAFDDEGLE
jgi:hypothetical protein